MLLELLFGLAFGQSVARTVPLHVRASDVSYGVCQDPRFRGVPSALFIAAPSAPPADRDRTPISPTEARRQLERAYRVILRHPPAPRVLALLMAQWALETGRGKNMRGFNFGGIKAISGGAAYGTQESFGRRKHRTVHQFRTYPNAFEGATDYVRTLFFDFPAAFEALLSGSSSGFVQALFAERYFTADPQEYERAITRLAEEYERTMVRLAERHPSERQTRPWNEVAGRGRLP